MQPLRRQTLVEQTAQHLREGISARHWAEYLPGVVSLATELGVSRDTVRAAIQLLEQEGALKAGGAGKRRMIIRRRNHLTSHRALRVAILLDDHLPSNNAHSQELFLSIKYTVEAAGHTCIFSEKSMRQLSSLPHLARFVRATKADAWIVYSGTREVLEWFAGQKTPVLAIGGRAPGLPIASAHTDLRRAMAAAVNALVTHGHHRIVLICDSNWRNPAPSLSARAFMDSLVRHGIKTSNFNLPEWEETPDGFERMMTSLFHTTPPTALVIVEPAVCVAARIFLAERGIVVPRDLSLVSMLPDPAFSLHRPKIAHFEWTIPALVNRAAQWVKAAARGTADREATFFHAKFRPCGTIAGVSSGSPIHSH